MNYASVHDKIIENTRKSQRSKKNDVYEEHHIVMRSLGGSDDKENLVLLTPKEHFIIHYLLWKMHPNERKYRDAIFMFKHKGAANSRLYEAARKSHVLMMKENNPSLYLTPDARKSKSTKLRSYTKTPEHRRKISESKKGNSVRKGAILDEETKSQISESVSKWHREVRVSSETREKLRLASSGRLHSKESISKCVESAKNRVRYRCPHCKKEFDGGNLKQHMIRNGFSLDDIESVKSMKPEGWTAPSHEGNHGNLPSD